MNSLTACLNTFFAAATFATFVPAAFAVEYTVRLLSPADANYQYTASGISGNRHVGTKFIPPLQDRAQMWVDGSSVAIELHPAGFRYSWATGVFDNHQVGHGAIQFLSHALLWNGTAESVVDLHPANFLHSNALAVGESSQVGIAWNDSQADPHAILWHGTSESAVDLHPDNWDWSHATGVSGDKQVGWGGSYGPKGSHAILWSGSPDSFVDLNPPGAARSWATGIHGSSQVGYGFFPYLPVPGQFTEHALVWYGTAESAVNLHPDGFDGSQALAVAGEYQVGFGTQVDGLSSTEKALLWKGSSDSVVNLHEYLGQLGNTFSTSHATGVNEKGEVVGRAVDASNKWRAVVWSPVVPEPNTFLLAVGVLLLSSLAPRSLRAAHRS
jgi:hypothetical protein